MHHLIITISQQLKTSTGWLSRQHIICPTLAQDIVLCLSSELWETWLHVFYSSPNGLSLLNLFGFAGLVQTIFKVVLYLNVHSKRWPRLSMFQTQQFVSHLSIKYLKVFLLYICGRTQKKTEKDSQTSECLRWPNLQGITKPQWLYILHLMHISWRRNHGALVVYVVFWIWNAF